MLRFIPLSKLRPLLIGAALTATLLLSGCQSPQDRAAVDAVAELFGGRVASKTGYTSSTDDKKLQGKYLAVEISGSVDQLKKQYEDLAVPASHCAYVLYGHAGRDYSFFQVTFKEADQQHEYAFSTKDLRIVDQKLSTLNVVFTDLQSAECAGIYPHINRKLIPLPELDERCQEMKKYAAQNGQGAFDLLGFRFQDKAFNGQPQMHLLAILGQGLHARNPRFYTFTFDTARDTADIIGIN